MERMDTTDLVETKPELLLKDGNLADLVGTQIERQQQVVEALLGKDGSDERFLQMLALMPYDELQKFIVEVLQNHSKPHQIEERLALLLTFLQMFPKSVYESRTIEIIRDTINTLLDEAPRRFIIYRNKYHFVIATKLFPLFLISKKDGDRGQFYQRVITVVVKYHLSCILECSSDEEAININPDSCWQSVHQLINEMFSAFKMSWCGFWKSSDSIVNLEHWWKMYCKWQSVHKNTGIFNDVLDFLVTLTFWAFLLHKYFYAKSLCDIPQRRPFLLRMGAGVSKQVVSHVGKMQLRKLSLYMEGIMNLSEKVWNILNDDDANRLLLSQTYSELRLDESSVFSTFRSDLAILIGRSLAIFDSDSFPYWLKTQLLAQHIAQSCKTPITLETFENICKLVRRLRVQGKFDVSRSIFDGEKSAMVAYIWDDQDLLAFCCMILLNHLQSDLMKPQSVDRISDEHLQVAFVLIQPVIGQYPDLFRHLFTVLEARQKFSFRQFFDFIISPEIVSEFSLLLGKVVMELRSESPSVGVSVHKTRGANRESTEALQADLQRHAFFMTSTGNHLFEAIQNYLTAETLTIIRILFPAVDNASPKRLKTA